jgi:trans-aconitate methyltransferase
LRNRKPLTGGGLRETARSPKPTTFGGDIPCTQKATIQRLQFHRERFQRKTDWFGACAAIALNIPGNGEVTEHVVVAARNNEKNAEYDSHFEMITIEVVATNHQE